MPRPFLPVHAAVFVLIATAAVAFAGDPLPDFGVMFNDDGDLSFTSMDPAESVRNLLAQVDSLAGTRVKTLTWCVGAGSDVLYYPTKVASVWGWRPLPDKYEKRWGTRVRKIRAGMEAGIDPIRVVGERAKALGMFFMPSYRMNDDHFIFDPLNYPLTGKFWMENHKKLKIGESPQPASEHYGNLFDFSHEEVRRFRLSVIFEVIGRYEDILDGIELDFNRFQMIFPKDKGPERAHLITEMIAQVRKRLDEAEKRQGREMYILVRVPPSLADCHRMGYRIEDWMEPRIADVIIPSQLMTISHDMPIQEFVDICRPAGARVYPTIYPRTSYMWPFLRDPKPGDYPKRPVRLVTPELVRGAIANYRREGAAGFQLYNFYLPADDWTYEIIRDAAAVPSLHDAARADKIFAVTPGYYLDYTDIYQYKKQLPATIEEGKPCVLTIPIGEDYSEPARKAAVDYCAIRLGFKKGFPKGDWEMELQANGMVLHKGSVAEELVATAGALVYFQTQVHDMAVFKQGKNTLRIVISGIPQIELDELLIGVFFRKHDLKL